MEVEKLKLGKYFDALKEGFKMGNSGQVNIIGVIVVGMSMAAIAGVLGILIFANVYNALNTELVSSGAVSLLDLTDLLLAAGLLLGILAGVMGLAVAFRAGR